MITGEQVYLPAFTSGQTFLQIKDTEFHHLIRVRRYATGDEIWVVNGQGISARAIIGTIDDATLELEVIEEFAERGELGVH